MSKLTIPSILLLSLVLLASASRVRAQGVSPYFGLGTATNSAGTGPGCPSGQLLNTLNIPTICQPGPTMGGVFGVFGGDFMFKSHLGVNAEYAFRFSQDEYLPVPSGGFDLKYRPAFYDFNAVWEPTSGADRHIIPVLMGGIGGVRIALYQSQTVSVTGISTNFSQSAGLSANHFQVHAGVGVKLYLHGNIFVKPQFDFHYVPHLTDQFGRNWVPRYTVAVGYTFGER